MQVLRFIFQNLDSYRRRFYAILVVQFLNGAVGFMIPVLLAEFTQHQFTSQRLVHLLVAITALYVVGLGLQWVVRYYGEALAFQFGNHIRTKYFRRAEQMSLDGLQKHHSGYILSLMNKIGDGLDNIMFEIPWFFASGLASIILFFYFTARQSLALACVNLALLSTFVVIGTLLARRMVPLAAEQNKRRASLLSSYADFMANIITIKKLGVQRFAEGAIRHKTDRVAAQINHVQRFHANRWFILHALYGVTYLSTIAYLLWGVSKGTISSSILILFVSAYVTIRGLIQQLSESIKSYMEMGAYLSNLQDILGDEPAVLPYHKHAGWHAIEFRDIKFQHSGGNQALFVDRFALHKGDSACIIGKSGQGKSTFLNLLTNHLAPQQGERLVDGVTYQQIDAAFFSDRVAIISQEVDLFSITIRENLTLGKPMDDKRIIVLLRQMDLGNWFDELQKGLDTIVGEKGITLSAGQKQRLNILRGILLDRDIYVLDEPTAHLDAATEGIVVDFLKKHLHGKTSVIVTHRPALRALCSTEYEIKDHRLVTK
jgi:ABC-type bacteriocin/lantibiotic exporter with double-glycine peptidase domain